ncbi:MAG TPA: CopD family protein [Saprospiraceae bacterium]|nr:CopD family protein [Saprospiraceae bacterium]
MTTILVLKSIHIFGFVSWLAGLFYLGRMFVYHREAYDDKEPDSRILTKRYSLMEERVYKMICNPGMMITWTAGILMLYFYGWEWFKANLWMHYKILLLISLTIYHLYCKMIMKKMGKGQKGLNSFHLRLFNEVPVLLLTGLVVLAVFKNMVPPHIVLLIILVLGIAIYFLARFYAQKRTKIDIYNND